MRALRRLTLSNVPLSQYFRVPGSVPAFGNRVIRDHKMPVATDGDSVCPSEHTCFSSGKSMDSCGPEKSLALHDNLCYS